MSLLNNAGLGKFILIKKWLDNIGIKNYNINADLTIDVNNDINLMGLGIDEFPSYIQFNIVKGYFDCTLNKFKSFKGFPKEIHGKFYCVYNQFETLEYFPEKLYGSVNCAFNQIKSLKGCPKKILGDFNCSYNKLTSLDGCPEFVKCKFDCSHNSLKALKNGPIIVGGHYDCSYNQLKSFEGCPEQLSECFYGFGNDENISKKYLTKYCEIKRDLIFI